MIRFKSENKPWRQYLSYSLTALVSIVLFLILLDDFYPYKAANIKITRSQAIEVAKDFMIEQDIDFEDFHLGVVMDYDDEAFIYLQKKYGFTVAQDMMRYKTQSGFDLYWRVFWYENLPRNAPQEYFYVLVSGSGDIVGYQHEKKSSSNRRLDRKKEHSIEEAREIAYQFLKRRQIDLEEFEVEISSTQKLEGKTDYILRWRKESSFDETTVELVVNIQDGVVWQFDIGYKISEREATILKQQSGDEYFFKQVAPISVFIIMGLLIFGMFLKKYHEGEVEIKHGARIFLFIWIAFAIQAALRYHVSGYGTSLGELSYNSVSLFLFIIFVFILVPFQSGFGLLSWSVGESLGRERFKEKFHAIDGLIHRKVATLDVARSIFKGFSVGVTALGIIAVLFTVALHYLNCTTRIENHRYVMTTTVPFLIPLVVAISAALMSELGFRFFGNFFFYKHLKVKAFAVIVTAALWAFYVPSFWPVHLTLFPLNYEIIIWFILGLYFGIMFWKNDLLTVIIGNFVAIGVIQLLPMLASYSIKLVSMGLVSLGLICLPIPFMVLGFIRRDKFTVKADLMPGHIKRITERVRMAKELEIARQVQMKLLPKESPKIPGFDIYGACIPANETGGDYFDFIELGDSKLGIVIGDVSGKGVPAAIYMTLTKGIVQSHADDFISPAEVMVKVNHLLYKTIERGAFVSLFYAVLDFEKKTILYSRAGHNPVLHFKNGNGRCDLLEPAGIALGLERGGTFQRVIREQELHLQKGDLLVFYTDGFTEAMNNRLDEYGEERLIDVIHNFAHHPTFKIYDSVLSDIKHFIKEMPQQDDMTMILVKGS